MRMSLPTRAGSMCWRWRNLGKPIIAQVHGYCLGAATQLALIQQTDKVYVNFTQSANEVQALRQEHQDEARHGNGFKRWLYTTALRNGVWHEYAFTLSAT